MSVEEKIRRAEEIYNRKMENENKTQRARFSVENKPNKSILRKMKNQILVCLGLYFIFYFIINGNYAFSENVRENLNKILEYDISLSKVYEGLSSLCENINTSINESLSEENQTESVKSENEGIENKDATETEDVGTESGKEGAEDANQNANAAAAENQDETSSSQKDASNENGQATDNVNTENNENIGGGTDKESSNDETISEEEQMKKDAQEIKSNISFIKPVNGTITSRFGWRDSNISYVSKYHTGLDMAVAQGTEIKAATDGKVTLTSSEGGYGNHLKVETNGITMLYAHCLKLCVNEGENITQGQKIAEVGSTGNSTGPHLHFEIIKEGRYVDPELVLDL